MESSRERQEAALQGYFRGVAITNDNKYIVYGSADSTLRVWNLQEKRQQAVLEGYINLVISVGITSDSKYIVSSDYSDTLRIWNLQEKRQEAVLQGLSNYDCNVAISSDNT